MNTQATRLLRSTTNRVWRVRLFRFLTVGAVNTLFGYGLFFVALRSGLAPTAALAIATILGVGFNFLSTGGLVFGGGDASRLWRFAAVYGAVFVVNAGALETLAALGADAALAQGALLPACVGLSYLLNRTLVFTSAAPEARS